MRYTLLLVAALGLIATAAPAVLAQETQPATTSTTTEQAPAPAVAPTVAGPIMAPAVASGCCQAAMASPCGQSCGQPCGQPIMQASCCQPGGYPYAAPVQTYGSRRGLFRGRSNR